MWMGCFINKADLVQPVPQDASSYGDRALDTREYLEIIRDYFFNSA